MELKPWLLRGRHLKNNMETGRKEDTTDVDALNYSDVQRLVREAVERGTSASSVARRIKSVLGHLVHGRPMVTFSDNGQRTAVIAVNRGGDLQTVGVNLTVT